MARIQFKTENIYQTRKVVDEGMYKLTLTGFNPKPIKPKDGSNISPGVNYNPTLEITARVDGKPIPVRDDGKPLQVFFSGPTTWEAAVNDFCHAFGLPLDDDGQGNSGLPGVWYPENEPDVTKCSYKGPLLSSGHNTCEAYLIKTTYDGQPKNEIKFFVCAVPNCVQKFPKMTHLKSFQRTGKKP
jgi:hypothetical protein